MREYRFIGLNPGNYSVVAFSDSIGTGKLRAGAALGFASARTGCFGNDEGSNVCVSVLVVSNENTTVEVPTIQLRKPTPFAPHAPNRTTPDGVGSCAMVRGRAVLRLGPGTAHERGVAHGTLVGRQVMDVLEFFLLEDRVRDMAAYETVVRPKLIAQRLFVTPDEALDEARGIVDGVRAAGVPLTLAASVGRGPWDIIALNAYGELTALADMPGRLRGGPQCSQLLFWGDRTKGSDVDGGTIAGRNMDGEIDVRKVTVTHLVIFAVDPGAAAGRRFASVMWPGFLGTYSGVNEDGLYLMANAGCGGRADTLPADGRYPIDTLVVRDFLTSKALVGGYVTPAAAARQINTLPTNGSTATGGVLPAGNILVIAQPYLGGTAGVAGAAGAADGGFIFEGDRDGGWVRRAYPTREGARDGGGDATEHAPLLWRSPPQTLLTTNHWHEYKTDPWGASFWPSGAGTLTCPSAAAAPDGGVGYDEAGVVSFSALRRYKACSEARERTSAGGDRRGASCATRCGGRDGAQHRRAGRRRAVVRPSTLRSPRRRWQARRTRPTRNGRPSASRSCSMCSHPA